MHDLLLSNFNLYYNLMNKPLFECAMTYKKICQHCQKNKKKLKNQDIKEYLNQRIIQKIFKNQKIHCLEIIETK